MHSLRCSLPLNRASNLSSRNPYSPTVKTSLATSLSTSCCAPRRYRHHAFKPLHCPSSSKPPSTQHHHRLSHPLYQTACLATFSTMAPIPSTMKAVQIAKNGGTEVLEYKDIPVPKPSDTQVLIRNQVAGINFIDTYFRTGLYKAPALPMTLGREAAGEIVAVGSAVDPSLGFKVGDKVVFAEGSAYAQYSAVDAGKVISIPDGIDAHTAAASLLQGLTAWAFVTAAADVQPGQWTLVHAAAGGTGSLLVQMLHHLGAKIIATASTEEKLALAKGYGADHLIKSSDDVVAKVKEITGGHGIDAIFDGVGKATFDSDLQMVANNGYLISFGNASGAVPPVNILSLGPKNVKLMRPVVMGYLAKRQDFERYTKELFDLILSKKVNIPSPTVYDLKNVAQAHSDLEGRKSTGKLLLRID